LDLLGQRVVGVLDAPQYAASIDVTPDERFLAVGGAALWVYDLTTGERVASDERFDNNIGHVGFSPSGDRLLVTAYDGRARSYAFSAGRLGERQVLPHRGTANVYAASFSKDGRRLVTSSGDQTLKVWER
jgi:WD40 repeat protein